VKNAVCIDGIVGRQPVGVGYSLGIGLPVQQIVPKGYLVLVRRLMCCCDLDCLQQHIDEGEDS